MGVSTLFSCTVRVSDMLVASAFINPLTKACHVAALTKPPRHLTHALTKLQTNGSHVAALTKPPRRLTYALTKPQIGTGRAPTLPFFLFNRHEIRMPFKNATIHVPSSSSYISSILI